MKKNQPTRSFMKSNLGDYPPGWKSDQQLDIPNPPLQKPLGDDVELIDLPKIDRGVKIPNRDVFDVINKRRSRRKFVDLPLSIEELALLLWATAGVKRVVGDNYVTMRTVPSAGARHAFETYLIVRNVEQLTPGVYRYAPLTHQLALLDRAADDLPERAAAAALGQEFVADAAVTFVWTCIPYRCEWRYGPEAYKLMLLDAGHIAQNLYLTAEALGVGCCGIAAYDQQAFDELLGLDGEDEYTVYLAPVGRLS